MKKFAKIRILLIHWFAYWVSILIFATAGGFADSDLSLIADFFLLLTYSVFSILIFWLVNGRASKINSIKQWNLKDHLRQFSLVYITMIVLVYFFFSSDSYRSVDFLDLSIVFIFFILPALLEIVTNFIYLRKVKLGKNMEKANRIMKRIFLTLISILFIYLLIRTFFSCKSYETLTFALQCDPGFMP